MDAAEAMGIYAHIAKHMQPVEGDGSLWARKQWTVIALGDEVERLRAELADMETLAAELGRQRLAVLALCAQWEREALNNAGPPSNRERGYLDPGNADDHRSAGRADAQDECAAQIRDALGGQP